MEERTHHHNLNPAKPPPGGIIHTYRGYDPRNFPLPEDKPPDVVWPAFEHMLAYGSMRQLTPEQLAEAIDLDPRQIAGLGPSIESLLAMLQQRKRKILETYETDTVRKAADKAYRDWVGRMQPPPQNKTEKFHNAVKSQQLIDLERLWYTLDERSDFAKHLLHAIDHLANKYQIEDLASSYVFTGKTELSIDQALQIKEELETIDRLIEQLKEAAKNAKVYRINLSDLARFANQEQVQELQAIQQQIAQLLEHLAQQQGLEQDGNQFRLTPKALKLVQTKLLEQIFSQLQAAKSGRHQINITGDGDVEQQRTKPYEFGDSLANMDITSSMINALARTGPGLPIRLQTQDIQVHLTRNTPKCATAVCMDMSGSMRWGGAYINVKRMALALHGLIRGDYPGDFLDFVEIHSLPKRRHISEVPQLLPMPVTLHEPVIRLKVDMSRPDVTDMDVPPHFTNIQHGLKLARQLLQVQDTPNRQIILITDGLPTAHFEDHWLYLLYPPHPRTEQFTLREAMLCKQQGIVINIFLLSGWSQSEEDIRFAHRLAEQTGGRVFFTAGDDLERFVVWDYVKRRRFIVG